MVKKMILKIFILLLVLFISGSLYSYEIERIWDSRNNSYTEVKSNQIIVQYKEIENLHQHPALTGSTSRMITGNTFLYEFDENIDVLNKINLLRNNDNVNFVQPNYIYRVDAQPVHVNDPDTPKQWYFNESNPYNLGLPHAWSHVTGEGSDLLIAVLDSGIDTSHPDLIGRIWGCDTNDYTPISGYTGDYFGFDAIFSKVIDDNGTPDYFFDDIVQNTRVPRDFHGHGTAVSSIIAANTNDNIGMAGIFRGGKILNVRVHGIDNYGTSEWVFKGIVYASRRGADIINMSLGREGSEDYLYEQIINKVYDRGTIIIASAGNDGSDRNNLPAAFNNVISVGSIDPDGTRSSFSNYGWHVDFMAPGKNIYVALPTFENELYDYWNGTSFSAPIVTGIAALVLALQPDLSPQEVRDIIRSGCIPVNRHGYGAGIVNARSTIRQLLEFRRRARQDLNTKVISYPNPFKANGTNEVTFEPLTNSNNLTVKIYTISGRYVNSISKVDTNNNFGVKATWDGRDDSGKLCAPGTYLFVSKTENGSDWGKLTIISW